jgi:hypothetical protein
MCIGASGSGLAPCALTLCVAYDPTHARVMDTEVFLNRVVKSTRHIAKRCNDRKMRTGQDLILLRFYYIVNDLLPIFQINMVNTHLHLVPIVEGQYTDLTLVPPKI